VEGGRLILGGGAELGGDGEEEGGEGVLGAAEAEETFFIARARNRYLRGGRR
jgi:hypothetical protein